MLSQRRDFLYDFVYEEGSPTPNHSSVSELREHLNEGHLMPLEESVEEISSPRQTPPTPAA
jgi:hypothetical protein